MGVTFTCPEAESTFVTTECESIVEGWCTEGARCGYCENGSVLMEQCEAPTVNLGRESAKTLLNLLQLSWSEHGSLGVTELSSVRSRLVKLLNVSSLRERALSAQFETEGGQAGVRLNREGNVTSFERMGAREVSLGVTDEQTVHRLNRLLTLVMWAQERQFQITWA